MGPRTILLDQDQLIAIMNGGDAAQAVVGEDDSGTNDIPAEDEPSQTEETEP